SCTCLSNSSATWYARSRSWGNAIFWVMRHMRARMMAPQRARARKSRTDASRSTRTASGAHQCGAPVKSGAEADEADEVPVLDPAGLAGFVQSDRDRRRGRVAVALDVVEDLLVRQLERALDHLVDAQVRLVGDEQVELADLDA